MKYILFIGCQIPARVPQYEMSARAVLDRIGVEIEDERQFNCCGYPMRDSDAKAFLLSSVRNLALAEKAGLDMLVLCKCCFGSLKKAEDIMSGSGEQQDEVRNILMKEGLEYHGNTKVNHLLSVLHKNVGLKQIDEKITKHYADLNIAVHYGCHALRPHSVTQFDDPVSPVIFDELVEITGGSSVDWKNKLECCGSHAMGINDDLSMSLTEKKLDSSIQAGADFICTACPYCQIQFDSVQEMIVSNGGREGAIGSILYPQLLGICMGINNERLGISENKIDISKIRSYLNEE